MALIPQGFCYFLQGDFLSAELEPIDDSVINELFKKQSGADQYHFRRIIDGENFIAKVQCVNDFQSIKRMKIWHVYDPLDKYHDDGLPKFFALREPR